MPKREPHDVLGVDRDASFATAKAAWRRLARAHHPDLSGDDPAAARAATRRMAEINAAYESLRRADVAARTTAGPEPPAKDDPGFEPSAPRRAAGPPQPKPTRPVTGRLDTSDTFQARNSTTGPSIRVDGPPPLRAERVRGEPPRASEPTGPMQRGRVHRFRRPADPTLEAARAHVIEFGKFHGHSLGEIAAFEPSYIDWLARTISRDPDLLAAARVLHDDLDRRGVARRIRPEPRPAGRSA